MTSNVQEKVNVIDCTLREGNQAPLVTFDQTQSIDIAKQLQLNGISMIEIGHPSASQLEFDRTKSVVDLDLSCPVLSHARASDQDIYAVAQTGAQWVGIFAGINQTSQMYRLNRTKNRILEVISSSVAYAKHLGLKVRYTVEDSSRTSKDLLLDAYETAINQGADRICFSDTVGILEPHQAGSMISKLKTAFPDIDIEVHLHDDRGLAMANALTAIEAGANWVSTSVNGVGERCGIVDTCAFLANLVYKGYRGKTCLENILTLSGMVEQITQSPPDCRRPIIGKNVFTHTAKLHVNAIKKHSNAYNWIEPKWLGLSNQFSDLTLAEEKEYAT